MSHKVVSGKNLGDSAEVVIEPVKGGEQKTLKSDVVLIATGRRPYTDKLGGENIGLNMNKRGQIEINEHFETNVKNVFAIGDVVQVILNFEWKFWFSRFYEFY